MPIDDLAVLIPCVRIVLMMRYRMETAAHTAEERVIVVRLGVTEHQRANARCIRPKCKNQNIHHEAKMLLMILRNARHRPLERKLSGVDPSLLGPERSFESLLDTSHGFKVLVQTHTIRCAAVTLQRLG